MQEDVKLGKKVMDNQSAIAILTKKLEEWESKPKEDSYQYEKSFVGVMQGLSEELLQLSVGEVPQDRNQKKVQTQVGQITVKKGHVLEPRGHFRQSPYLQETALHLGQGHTFNESSQLLKRLCGVDLSDKQAENLCHHYGGQLEDVAVEDIVEVPEEPTSLHYALVDGSYILSREQGWAATAFRFVV